MPNPSTTFPNQRMIKVHRERAKSDFLGIKNENWQSASRDLGAHALQLYLYLASNADNYTTALSPVAVRQAIGMARSTYHDQFHKLVDRGYLVPSHGNTYDFYEVPKSATQSQNSVSDVGLNFEDCPPDDRDVELHGHTVSAEDTEIDNMTNTPDSSGTNKGIESSEGRPTIEVPKVREIVISRPVAQGRERPVYSPPSRGEFVF